MKKIGKFLIVFFILNSSFFISFADPPLPPSAHGSEGNSEPRGAPIDGGLGILLALGAGYGGMKLYKNRKNADREEEKLEGE